MNTSFYCLISLHTKIIDQYELDNLVYNGKIYIEIRKRMYGLPQASIIVNKKLQAILAPHEDGCKEENK